MLVFLIRLPHSHTHTHTHTHTHILLVSLFAFLIICLLACLFVRLLPCLLVFWLACMVVCLLHLLLLFLLHFFCFLSLCPQISCFHALHVFFWLTSYCSLSSWCPIFSFLHGTLNFSFLCRCPPLYFGFFYHFCLQISVRILCLTGFVFKFSVFH